MLKRHSPLLLALSVIMLSGCGTIFGRCAQCQATYEKAPHLGVKNIRKNVVVGKSTKEEVKSALGKPDSIEFPGDDDSNSFGVFPYKGNGISLFDEYKAVERWYYRKEYSKENCSCSNYNRYVAPEIYFSKEGIVTYIRIGGSPRGWSSYR